LKKIHSKRVPEELGQGAFTPPTTNSVGDLRSPEELGVNEGFTDSETDDTTISSDSLYEYIDFIPEPTNFRGRRIGLIQDISSYP
jgi:hypothetical protein